MRDPGTAVKDGEFYSAAQEDPHEFKGSSGEC